MRSVPPVLFAAMIASRRLILPSAPFAATRAAIVDVLPSAPSLVVSTISPLVTAALRANSDVLP
jgi:hypothetical protein